MSIFGKIASAIFGTAKSVGNAISGAASAVESAVVDSVTKKPEPMTRDQVDAMIPDTRIIIGSSRS